MKLQIDRSITPELQSLVAAANARLSAPHAVDRLRALDHRLWKQDPTDINNRLGWLTIIEYMKDRAEELRTFATSAKKRGIRDVVRLGMGGSSLEPVRIPGKKPFTFRTLAQAQAAGDIQALQAHDQQTIVLPLGKNPTATIQVLTRSLAPRAPARHSTTSRTRSGRGRKK